MFKDLFKVVHWNKHLFGQVKDALSAGTSSYDLQVRISTHGTFGGQ